MTVNSAFSINAKTCTLKYNNQAGNAAILNDNQHYIIPIYQRPYSWKEEQIRKFISDIFASFWGNDGDSAEEPIFIGTMQLAAKNEDAGQEVIDGQQRLTTLLLLLKVLHVTFPTCEELNSISLTWLSTRVNNGKQQEKLKEAINSDLSANENSQNTYLQNALLIQELVGEQIKEEEEQINHFNINQFVKYLLSQVYFVVIETRAGLSKTLQIFNAINTTGLDLNGGDIFKIRMYEYLRDKKGHDETAFDAISGLYSLIDKNNAKLPKQAANITDILGIYQYILIAQYNLPQTLYSYGTDTFFERLFDTILNVNQWEHFNKNAQNLELSLEAIERIIEVRFAWENTYYQTAEDACAMHFIWWSRYSRYWTLMFVFLYKFKDEEEYWNKMLAFIRQLSKLFLIYSIRYQKAVNEVHTFTYSLIKKIMDGNYDEVMSSLNAKIGTLDNHRGYYDLEHKLNGDIASNAKIKNLVCRLSAMLDETYKTTDEATIEKIRKALFEIKIDIEHIQSYKDKDGKKREDIWAAWQENIHSIGNLMILEENINRSLQNKPYELKREQYATSSITIVRHQAEKHATWNLDQCLIRKGVETKKILDYIFS